MVSHRDYQKKYVDLHRELSVSRVSSSKFLKGRGGGGIHRLSKILEASIALVTLLTFPSVHLIFSSVVSVAFQL